MNKKTILVTGANTGIGYWTAHGLACQGARVILACRNRERGAAAVRQLREETGGDIQLRLLDLASLADVRRFADDYLADEPALHGLVNNAGIMPLRSWLTEDGFEANMAVNYLGPLLLTERLLPALKEHGGRITHLSSLMHRFGRADLGAARSRGRGVWPFGYSTSKLLLLMYSNALAQELEGTGVTSNAVHPGVVATDIVRGFPRWMQKVMHAGSADPARAASTSIRVASDPALAGVSGRYFVNETEARASVTARDLAQAARLTGESRALVAGFL